MWGRVPQRLCGGGEAVELSYPNKNMHGMYNIHFLILIKVLQARTPTKIDVNFPNASREGLRQMLNDKADTRSVSEVLVGDHPDVI